MTERQQPPTPGPDGLKRTREEEDRLDSICAQALSGAAGEELLDYLKSITLNLVCGPAATDAQLRHLEGQRQLVQVLDERRRRGQRKASSKGNS